MNAEPKEQDSPAPSAERTEASQEISAAGAQADKPKTEANGDGTANGASANGQKPNPKDPSRPRRKKARRACFACQRAHLTCGTTDLTSSVAYIQPFTLQLHMRLAPIHAHSSGACLLRV